MIIVLKNLVNKEEMYLTLIFGDIKFTNDISIAADFSAEDGLRLVENLNEMNRRFNVTNKVFELADNN
jgi:hypothetical protein